MKSLYNKLAEALEALDKAGKRKQFDEKVRIEMTTETRLNLAESILGEKISNKYESAAPIKKNNGAGDTYVEGNPFRPVEEFRENGSRNAGGTTITETDPKITERRKLMVESVADSMGCSKKEARAFLGLPPKKPKGYKDLSEGQKKEFDFARAIGISEDDAFRLVAITGGYKQASR